MLVLLLLFVANIKFLRYTIDMYLILYPYIFSSSCVSGATAEYVVPYKYKAKRRPNRTENLQKRFICAFCAPLPMHWYMPIGEDERVRNDKMNKSNKKKYRIKQQQSQINNFFPFFFTLSPPFSFYLFRSISLIRSYSYRQQRIFRIHTNEWFWYTIASYFGYRTFDFIQNVN